MREFDVLLYRLWQVSHFSFFLINPLILWWERAGWQKGWQFLKAYKMVPDEVLQCWSDYLGTERQQQRLLETLLQWSPQDLFFEKNHFELNQVREHWISYRSPLYPPRLLEREDSPLILWSHQSWQKELIEVFFSKGQPSLAVVGSRRMSAYGKQATEWLVRTLVEKYNYRILSGCALGIDTVAHIAALRSGGSTVGVWAGSIDSLPARSQYLVNNDKALVISELPPGTSPQQWSFPQRNRLIAALADAVLVIEAQERSGTLITAAAALQHGKEVFVLSHPFTSPNAKGVCRLVEQGAHLITSAEDIHQRLFPQSSSLVKKSQVNEGQIPTEILRQCRTPQECSVVTMLWDQGGEVLESLLFSQVKSQFDQKGETLSLAQWQEALLSLELRGVLSQNIGVLHLSCMIPKEMKR